MKNIGRDFEVARVEPLQRRSPRPTIVQEYHLCRYCDTFLEAAEIPNAFRSRDLWLRKIDVITGGISNQLPLHNFAFT